MNKTNFRRIKILDVKRYFIFFIKTVTFSLPRNSIIRNRWELVVYYIPEKKNIKLILLIYNKNDSIINHRKALFKHDGT